MTPVRLGRRRVSPLFGDIYYVRALVLQCALLMTPDDLCSKFCVFVCVCVLCAGTPRSAKFASLMTRLVQDEAGAALWKRKILDDVEGLPDLQK